MWPMMGWTTSPVSGRREPEDGDLVSVGAEVLVDGAHVGHLQRPAELDAQEAEAHVPDLPEAQVRSLDASGASIRRAGLLRPCSGPPSQDYLMSRTCPSWGPRASVQPPIRAQRAERLLLEEVRDHAAGRRGLDGHRLADGRAAEVDGRDLGPLAVGKPVDHDDQAPGLHRRDVDLLALVDAVLGAHAQHLLQLPGERSGTRELLGQRAVERLGARQVRARLGRARVLCRAGRRSPG